MLSLNVRCPNEVLEAFHRIEPVPAQDFLPLFNNGLLRRADTVLIDDVMRMWLLHACWRLDTSVAQDLVAPVARQSVELGLREARRERRVRRMKAGGTGLAVGECPALLDCVETLGDRAGLYQ